MTETTPLEQEPRSFLRAALSLLLPGLGQFVGGLRSRGLIVFTTTATLIGLTIWTSAQRARFPDYALSARAFMVLLLETGALILFLVALNYLLARYALRTALGQTISRALMLVVAAAAIGLVSDLLIGTAIQPSLENQIYGLTSVFGAALVAAIWLWNVRDASVASPGAVPSTTSLVLLGSLALLVLGTRVTQVDLQKAIREYRDTEIILRRIVWPWRSAFVYDAEDVTAESRIQAPCPEGATGPEVNVPQAERAWIVVTPTCGQMSERDLLGNVELGTLLTIEGGNFVPNEPAEIRWVNPILNEFTPRGVGETEIDVSADGSFTSELYVPADIISTTAEGDQIHRLRVFQPGQRIFTGELSREMKLALSEMLVTIMMGLMATFVGIVLSVPFSFMAARNIMGTVRTTLEGFVGGIFGFALGAWVGAQLAGYLSGLIGGLERAPIPTALIYLVLVVGGGIALYSIVGGFTRRLSDVILPALGALILSVIGLGVIGGVIGYLLGVGFTRGILGLIYSAEVAEALQPGIALIGAAIVGAWFGVLAYRIRPGGEVTTGNLVYVFIRTILNIVRSIEPLIWAIIGIIWVGPGPFAGFVALTLHTIAALGKLYSEAIESIDPGPIEALQAAGATRLQTIVYAVIPQVLPPFISFTIYRWDINVRLSTIIGLVGGGGIGFLLIQWIRQFQYANAGIAVWLITITVAVLDFVSAEIRERFV